MKFPFFLLLLFLASCNSTTPPSSETSPETSPTTSPSTSPSTAESDPVVPNDSISEPSRCISSITDGIGTVTARVSGATSAPYGFLEYLPAGYNADDKNYPVIVFLHGLGEKGTDSATTLQSKMSSHGPFKRISQGRHFPALVFAPQSPGWWSSGTLKTFLEWIELNYRVDRSRIYLTGLSMGGGGTWDYLRFDSARIAAAIPVCGASSANQSASEREALVKVPLFSVHNMDDGVVTYRNSESFANSLGASQSSRNSVLDQYASGSDVTMYYDAVAEEWIQVEGSLKLKDSSGAFHKSTSLFAFDASGGHNAWTKTYASEDTWEWLFCQRKSL